MMIGASENFDNLGLRGEVAELGWWGYAHVVGNIAVHGTGCL